MANPLPIRVSYLLEVLREDPGEWLPVNTICNVASKTVRAALEAGVIERQGASRNLMGDRYRLAGTEADLGDLWVE